MKKMILFLYMICALLFLVLLPGCSSTGSSGGSYSTSYHYGYSSWDYDNDYRSGVNDHYNRPAVKARAISNGDVRSGGGRAGGGRAGGGGRR